MNAVYSIQDEHGYLIRYITCKLPDKFIGCEDSPEAHNHVLGMTDGWRCIAYSADFVGYSIEGLNVRSSACGRVWADSREDLIKALEAAIKALRSNTFANGISEPTVEFEYTNKNYITYRGK